MKTLGLKMVFLFIMIIIWSVSIANVAESKVPRKEELLLEVIINDLISRNQIKRNFPFPYKFEAYSSVLPGSIVVYVYCRIPCKTRGYERCRSVQKDATRQFPMLEEYMKELINKTILAFPDFEWARAYKLDIVPRISIEPSK